ncbi:hypothetical protein PRK78_000667 [Emydomyces testavorans]|uniref:Transmembrane protein n=1 Tax=Emydomyces testavorans TaxID=2070801 RepID=A0AAF0DBH8_9EURO|nr:hypothetical protein PRK78_000667 [Emydomyces testavorans]
MGYHGKRKHKRKHAVLFTNKTKQQEDNEGARRGGAPVLLETEKRRGLPTRIWVEPNIHQSTDRSHADLLHGHHSTSLHARQVPSASKAVVVKTVVHVVLENGSTVGTFTVGTLPATVSNSQLGVITIPAESNSPIVVSSLPKSTASQTASVSVSATGISSSISAITSTSLETRSSLPVSQPSPTSSGYQGSPTNTAPSDVILVPSITSTVPVTTSSSPSALSTFTITPSPVTSTSNVLSLLSSEVVSSISSNLSNISSTSSRSSSSVWTTASTTSSSTTSTSFTSSSAFSKSSSEVYLGGDGGITTGNGGPVPTSSTVTQAQGPVKPGLSSPQLIGVIVGSVSGFLFLIWVIAIAIRLRRQKSSQARALPEGPDQPSMAVRSAPGGSNMSPRSSLLTANLFAPARAFSRWRNSGQSFRAEEVAPTQRGFEKLGGRKLKPVLETGGDGYDDKFGASEKVYESGAIAKELETGAASASYAQPTDKETGRSRAIPSPPLGRPASQESDTSEKVLFRPSPARAITTESCVPGTSLRTSARAGIVPSMPWPPRPSYSSMRALSTDAIGRSHSSADGSRNSRFTEGVN